MFIYHIHQCYYIYYVVHYITSSYLSYNLYFLTAFIEFPLHPILDSGKPQIWLIFLWIYFVCIWSKKTYQQILQSLTIFHNVHTHRTLFLKSEICTSMPYLFLSFLISSHLVVTCFFSLYMTLFLFLLCLFFCVALDFTCK